MTIEMQPELCAQYGAEAVKVGSPDFAENDARTNLVDTLANLMHHADAEAIDFADALASAEGHYQAEERAEEREEVAEEFEENALGEVADYLREHGIPATRQWLTEKIAEVRAGKDPWDPTGESIGNLEVARDRLA